MAYVPPHKRLSTKSTPATPPSSSSSSWSRNLKPELRIHRDDRYVGLFFVLTGDRNTRELPQLEFERYHGETFAHLQGRPVYRLKMSGSSRDADHRSTPPCDDKPEAVESEGADQTAGVYDVDLVLLLKSLQPSLKEVLERCKTHVQAYPENSLRPDMRLRFGKVLLHSDHRGLDWEQRYSPDFLQNSIRKGSGISKTFENGLSSDEFSCLQDLVLSSDYQRHSKELFVLEVEDQLNPKSHLWLTCILPQSDKEHSDIVKTNHMHLHIIKVRYSPVRHLVADIAFINRARDMRLFSATRERLTDLTEDENKDLRSILDNAHIDKNVKGGLRWALGGEYSITRRFKAVGSWHVVRTSVIRAGLKWQFQVCNRGEHKASSGRLTYEVSVKPAVYNDYRKGKVDWDTDELVRCIEKMLKQIWTDYL